MDLCPHEDKMDRIYLSVVKLDKLITGNGDPSTGIILRLDRIEQFARRIEERDRLRDEEERSRRISVFAAVASAVIASVVGAIGWIKN